MTKDTLLNNIKKIAQMYPYELEKFKNNLAISNVDERARAFLIRTIEFRENELNNKFDAVAENGEIRGGEIE